MQPFGKVLIPKEKVRIYAGTWYLGPALIVANGGKLLCNRYVVDESWDKRSWGLTRFVHPMEVGCNFPCFGTEVRVRLGVFDLVSREVSMRPILAGSLVLILAVVQIASGQETSGAAPAAVAASPAAGQAAAPAGGAEAAEKYKLAEGTDVELQFAQDLSSSTSFEGDPVALTLVKDLKVGDVVVAKAGSSAYGVVTKAHKSGMMGKSGQLDIRLDYLKAGDNKIKLRETKSKESEGGVKGALLSPFGRVKHGKNVEINVGDPMHAYVAQDILLPPVS